MLKRLPDEAFEVVDIDDVEGHEPAEGDEPRRRADWRGVRGGTMHMLHILLHAEAVYG